jgi:hypothetical protein
MAALCRRLEKQYKLQEVLSPKDRLLPRQDQRKEKLKTDIRQTLEKVRNYAEFEQRMQTLGYKLVKGRGISFIDDKKVKTKGSEVGFSLSKMEKILTLKQEMATKQAEQKRYEAAFRHDNTEQKTLSHAQKILRKTQQVVYIERSPIVPVIKELTTLLELLLQPVDTSNYLPYELTEEGIKRKKRKQKSHRI